jgi:hypothetical protein
MMQVANLVGYVIGPSGFNWLFAQFLSRQGIISSSCLLCEFRNFAFFFGTLECQTLGIHEVQGLVVSI